MTKYSDFKNILYFYISNCTRLLTETMKFEVDHNSSTPLHVQAEKLLRALVEKKEYQEGKLLPNEVELSNQLGISRNTLRYAILKLVNEGLLSRKKGYGTKVSRKGVLGRAKNWLSFSQEMKALGITVFNFELHVGWQIPNPDVAAFFETKPDVRVLTLERLRGKENFPFVYFISWFNPEIGITGNDDFSRPLYDILEHDYHVVPTISRENITAQLASAVMAGKLRIRPGDPILHRERYVLDPGERPLEYNIGYYRADRFTYSIDIRRQ